MRRCFARVEKKAAFATWMARARKAILHDVSGRLTLAQQHGEAMRVAEAATRDRSAARAVEDREQIERHAARVSEAEEEVRVLHIAPLPIGSTHCSAAICTLSPETLIETLATAVSLCCVLKVQAARLELENVKTAMRERMLAHLHAQSVHDRRHATHMLSKPHTCSASHTRAQQATHVLSKPHMLSVSLIDPRCNALATLPDAPLLCLCSQPFTRRFIVCVTTSSSLHRRAAGASSASGRYAAPLVELGPRVPDCECREEARQRKGASRGGVSQGATPSRAGLRGVACAMAAASRGEGDDAKGSFRREEDDSARWGGGSNHGGKTGGERRGRGLTNDSMRAREAERRILFVPPSTLPPSL